MVNALQGPASFVGPHGVSPESSPRGRMWWDTATDLCGAITITCGAPVTSARLRPRDELASGRIRLPTFLRLAHAVHDVAGAPGVLAHLDSATEALRHPGQMRDDDNKASILRHALHTGQGKVE